MCSAKAIKLDVTTQAIGSRLLIVASALDTSRIQDIKLELSDHKSDPFAKEFDPYERDAITELLWQRLKLLPGPVFSPGAIAYLALMVCLW